jgi:hypothetical protein
MKLHGMKLIQQYQATPVKSLSLDGNQLLAATGNDVLSFNTKILRISDTVWKERSTCACKKDNGYFIGTLNGLYFINSSRQPTFLGEKIPLFRGRIMSLQADLDGMLWIATNGQGVIGYKDGLIQHHITTDDGLTSNICRNIFLDSNNIWIGTPKGLNRLSFRNGQPRITQFTTSDGLASDIINAIYVEGKMVYVGSAAGLTYFDLTKIPSNSNCILRFTEIRTPNHTWSSDTSGFTLPYNENSIQFDFVGISYKSGGDISYRYRLSGLDTAWQTTHQTSLNFPALPSGDYQLQLFALNKFGIQSKVTNISFKIAPTLWEKSWFRIFATILFLTLVWIIVNVRIRFIRRQEDQKLQITKRINELEQMALKAQMNPHFIFNSLNSIQQYVIDKNLPGANKFITEFASLIRLTLELSSKPEVNLEDEIKYLSTYLELEKTKLEDQFNYQVSVQDVVNRTNWQVPPMILQPYLENAIRHGIRYRSDKKGMIRILFEKKDSYLTCIISDNGIGREKSKMLKERLTIPIEYQSRGMVLTAKRVEMINRYSSRPIIIRVEVSDDTNQEYPGTKVTVNFPVKEMQSELN